MNDYLQLTKPRITWLILMSMAVGYFFGLRGEWNWLVALHTLLGTGLIASGTAALNQWWERDEDSRMNRTSGRPLPSGRIDPNRALMFGAGLSLLGALELWFGANPLAAVLGVLTLAGYLFVYTPLKIRTPHATTIGAIPGAMPPVIGFAASAGTLNAEAAILFVILFLWQFPHFYSIAWIYREDYSRAGIRMLPVIDPTGERTARRMVVYSLLLLPISLVPGLLGMAGNFYLVGAVALGCAYLFYSMLAQRELTRPRARRVLMTSIVYLPVLYGLLLLDRLPL